MCYPYDDEDDEGNKFMSIAVNDGEILKKSPVGTRVKFQVSGIVDSVTAPKKVRDYSVDWDQKKNSKPPMKMRPGHVKLKLDKSDPDIELLNMQLRDGED